MRRQGEPMVLGDDDARERNGPNEPSVSQSDPGESEEDLMASYVAGNPAAFDRLFARIAPRVWRFFTRSFADASVVEDLVQATFLGVHRSKESYRRELPLRPWLFTIAARVRMDELRRRYRLARDVDEEAWARIDSVASQSEGADDSVARGQLSAKVRAAIEGLPESQRVVVHLHRFEGMPFADIARVLGTTEGAVKVRACRAYEQLRREFEDLLPKGGR